MPGSATVKSVNPGGPPAVFRSPLRYPGGKQKAIKRIAAMLPPGAAEFREPMVGGGSVYFHARSTGFATKYWINDQFDDLIAFWRAAQDARTCKSMVDSLFAMRRNLENAGDLKKFFLSARGREPADCLEQALLFFFFNRVTFSGTTRAGGFSASAGMLRFTESAIARLEKMPAALAGTRITNLGFEAVLAEPGDDVFVFLDPPYYTASRLYGRNGALHQFDHAGLASMLRATPHRFLVTYDDCPAVRRLYKWARVSEWSLQYGMNNCSMSGESKMGSELFIRNY